IEPTTGQVLAIVSSPSYDPNLLVGRHFSSNFALLEQDKSAPLFHRPIMAMYPPGSIFKLVQALVGLQEKVLHRHTRYQCNKRLVKCHAHPSPLPLHQAIQYSCNPYFYHVFRNIINQQVVEDTYEDTRIGLAKWRRYLYDLGLGTTLAIDLPGEKQGFVPSAQFYDARYGPGRWKVSTIRSLDIGQGELLVTPLQMANLAATIANRGYYYTPHLVQQVGQATTEPKTTTKHTVSIDPAHFEFVAQAMHQSVEAGTSWRVRIKGIPVCAKTGTAENPHGEDHAACIAFAPLKNPSIALAVYVENAGWGARAGAAVAGLVVEHYLRQSISRPWIENYVLKGDFFH
ncbi:MAG: penicillin-binding transpeptidase domain-containing protein, partial [Bacteroidota bacterium]